MDSARHSADHRQIILAGFSQVWALSVQRLIGTIFGGFFAYGIRLAWGNWIFLSIVTVIVALLAITFSDTAAYASTGRFFLITFWVIYFEMWLEGSTSIALPLTRIIGISSGILMTVVVSLTVFPSIASLNVLTHIGQALDALEVVNALIWNEYRVTRRANVDEAMQLFNYSNFPELYEAQKKMNRSFAVLREDVADMKREVYIGATCSGHFHIFLPKLFIGGLNRRYVPEARVINVLRALMCGTRVLWSIELICSHGFTEVEWRCIEVAQIGTITLQKLEQGLIEIVRKIGFTYKEVRKKREEGEVAVQDIDEDLVRLKEMLGALGTPELEGKSKDRWTAFVHTVEIYLEELKQIHCTALELIYASGGIQEPEVSGLHGDEEMGVVPGEPFPPNPDDPPPVNDAKEL